MRSSKSRSRSKANRPRTLGNIVNRVFDSSGPDGKVRGTPAQIIEKYQFLARDAQLSNDRVGAENFLQHAEHYTRMLAEAMREMQSEQDARQQYTQASQGSQTAPTYQGGNVGGTQGGYSGGNQNGNRDGQRDGQRESRYEPRRDDRYDRVNEPASGLGPVIGAEDDGEAGPVPTPEATVSVPRFDRNRQDNQRQDNQRQDSQRQDNQRQDNQRQDNARQDRPEPRQDRSEPREPRFTQSAPPPASQQTEEPAATPPRRTPRPYPPRARAAVEDQPGLPSFITDPIAVIADPVPAVPADKPKPAPRPRKPAAPKVAAPAETADTKSDE